MPLRASHSWNRRRGYLKFTESFNVGGAGTLTEGRSMNTEVFFAVLAALIVFKLLQIGCNVLLDALEIFVGFTAKSIVFVVRRIGGRKSRRFFVLSEPEPGSVASDHDAGAGFRAGR